MNWISGRYGPNFKEWLDDNDRNVTSEMPRPELNCSGVGVRLGLVIPL